MRRMVCLSRKSDRKRRLPFNLVSTVDNQLEVINTDQKEQGGTRMFTILMAPFNVKKYIGQQVESILHQTKGSNLHFLLHLTC